ncbi:hypothetical protein DIURU_003582 [Diutina rugosa]|uniref:Uncharacterized protein n=1 Tax=Diutina rugosa TaxID=5481 RepID=A0A642UL49_DIURU|nr:uncharacterized protein DIURU_003582 [Diutina rugosa]KAA8901212.1 hypothetical protein DIURU_003582 [Diutina rugosa]
MVEPEEVIDHLRLLRAFQRMFSGIHEWVEFETSSRVRFIHTLLVNEAEELTNDIAIPLEVVYLWYYHTLHDKPVHSYAPLPKWNISDFARYVDDDDFYVPPPEAQTRFEEASSLSFVHHPSRLEWYCSCCSSLLGRWSVEWFHNNHIINTFCVCREGEGPMQDEIARRWLAAAAERGDWDGEGVSFLLKLYMKYAVSHRKLVFDLLHTDEPVGEVIDHHTTRWNRPVKSHAYHRMLEERVFDMALAAAPPIQGMVPLTTKFSVYNLCDGHDDHFRRTIADYCRELEWADNILAALDVSEAIFQVDAGLVDERAVTHAQKLVRDTITISNNTRGSQGITSHMGRALDRVKPPSAGSG